MRGSFFWLPGPWSGHLAIALRPRGGEWLDTELAAWRTAGTDTIVSLLEPTEEAELGLASEAATATAHGLEFISFPIPDRGVPTSQQAMHQLVAHLNAALNADRNIVVHCRQGVGRSAVIAAATLIGAGQAVDSAVDTVSRARGVPVPETAAQRRWLSEFASWVRHRDPERPGT